jgi:endonuclease/exonuclease/phosphatase family metal-dependent hydrolase
VTDLQVSRAMASLRVVTWNVRTCRTREDDRVDLDLTAATLRSLDADLVALQEIDRDQERSGHIDQARALGEALGMAWYFAPALLGPAERPQSWRRSGLGGDSRGPAYGIAMLSRWELEATEIVALPYGGGRREPRIALLARTRAGGRPLSVAATHLSVATRDAVRQIRWLQHRLSRSRYPCARMLLGDLNLWLPVVRLVSLPGWRSLVRGATFPNDGPAPRRRGVQIDHVMAAGAGLEMRHARIVSVPISDHRAVIVDLDINRKP